MNSRIPSPLAAVGAVLVGAVATLLAAVPAHAAIPVAYVAMGASYSAGFVEVITTCLLGTDGACTFAVNAGKAYATGVLPGKLDHTYQSIRSRAPHARVIVLGYPRLFEQTTSCGLFGMDLAKRRTLDGAADTLDGVLAARAAAAGFTFVDVRGIFAGHGICAGQAWINSTTWPVTDSYHPNSSGYRSGYLVGLDGLTG